MSGSQRSGSDEAPKLPEIIRSLEASEAGLAPGGYAAATVAHLDREQVRAVPFVTDEQMSGWAKFWSEPSIGRAYSLSALLTVSAMIGCGVESLWSNTDGWKYE